MHVATPHERGASVRIPELSPLLSGDFGVYESWLVVCHWLVEPFSAELLSTLNGSDPEGLNVERYGWVRRLATTPLNCGHTPQPLCQCATCVRYSAYGGRGAALKRVQM